jgi:ketosteroid isomerase-like protein
MSRENVEKVRRFFDLMNRGDYKAAIALAHPEIEMQDHPGVDAGDWNYGREGAWQWGAKLNEAFPGFQIQTEAVVAVDQDIVLTFGVWSGKGARSGIPVSTKFGGVITFQDGLGKRVAVYGTTADALRGAAEALEVVGLSE